MTETRCSSRDVIELPGVHLHMMSIEEEDGGGYQGDIEVLDVDLNLLGVDVHQRDRRELRDLTRGLGELRARRPHEIRGFAKHREDEVQDMGGEGRSVRFRRSGGTEGRRRGRSGGRGPCRGCRG